MSSSPPAPRASDATWIALAVLITMMAWIPAAALGVGLSRAMANDFPSQARVIEPLIQLLFACLSAFAGSYVAARYREERVDGRRRVFLGAISGALAAGFACSLLIFFAHLSVSPPLVLALLVPVLALALAGAGGAVFAMRARRGDVKHDK